MHLPIFAPTKEILDEYKKNKGDWSVYEKEFNELLLKRAHEGNLPVDIISGRDCLLCSEEKPDKCHRRLVADT